MSPNQAAVFTRITEQVLGAPSDTPYLVGINGKDAAGKTIFSDALANHLRSKTNREIIRISIDDFMNPQAIRNTLSNSPAESAYLYTFDLEAFKTFALEPLLPGNSFIYKTKMFNESTDRPDIGGDHRASNDSIVIVDGALLFKTELSDYFSLKVLLDVSDNTAMKRGVERDIARGKARTMSEHLAYRDVYIQCQAIYYRNDRPVEKADIVIDNNDYEVPKILRMFGQNFVN